MNRSTGMMVACIYGPLSAALLARAVNGRRPRQLAACLLGTLWVAATLPLVAKVNLWAKWWKFGTSLPSATFAGVPLALYVGWVILWGPLPTLMFPKMRLRWVALFLACIDLCVMPAMEPVVSLSKSWVVGEAVAVGVVLLPALCLSRWTIESRFLYGRASLQIILAGLLFLFLLPEVVFALRPDSGWAPLLGAPSWMRQLNLQVIFLLAVPGISAVFEFAERGQGTPIPYDPPQKLVVSGIYRYVANPMQLSCSLVMVGWASLLRNGWMAAGAVMVIVYGAGIAEWDERRDLRRRFGEDWIAYRREVKNWFPRWRPFVGGHRSHLYIASTCGPCGALWLWIATRQPEGLEIVAAETLPAGSIHRMRYEPEDGSWSVDGIRALGRALEHLHLGWAFCGFIMRLPGIWNAIQLVMDVAGFGPRNLSGITIENRERPVKQD